MEQEKGTRREWRIMGRSAIRSRKAGGWKAKGGRLLASLLAILLLAGSLGACGQDRQEEGSQPGTGGGGGERTEPVKGRYVEKQETLPEELSGQTVLQMYAVDGKLHFLTSTRQDGKTAFREWERTGDSYTDVTKAWLSSLELDCGDWVDVHFTQKEGGNQYLYAGYVAEGEEAFKGHLWKEEGDTAREITPEKWTVPNEQWGSYEMIQGIASLQDGTLAALSYVSLDILSGEDGSVITSDPVSSVYEGGIVTDGENLYLRSSDETGGQIEKYTGGKMGDPVSIPYPSGDSVTNQDGTARSGIYNFGGTGSLVLCALPDGTLVSAGENGIFRLPSGEEQGQWEQLAAGMDTDFGLSDYYCTDFVALEDGSIYAMFSMDSGIKLNSYVYDPNAVSEVTTVLKLYTVYENSLLKQAATLYHKAHPEVLITIENEYPQYYLDTPDYDTVFQKLNTRLLGDDVPDILVMDHLNTDSYAEKGLLLDLDEIIRPLEESGEVLSNITGAYVGEDQKRYVVPLQFSFPMIMGRDITPADMGTMEALADFLSGATDSYMGSRTVAELVDAFYPYFCARIVKDKQLDREALGRYLEYLKAIGDNCGIIASRPENEMPLGMWDLSGPARLAIQKVGGFTDCMFPMSMVKLIQGDYTAFENRFIPSMEMGICTKSPHQDVAKDFLAFALSQTVQDTENYKGFPVNSKSLQTLAAKDRSQYSAATMIVSSDGGYNEFVSEAYPKETADRLAALCGTLTEPIREDAKIKEVLTQCLGGYLDGTQTMEETIQKIEDSLRMYLAE